MSKAGKVGAGIAVAGVVIVKIMVKLGVGFGLGTGVAAAEVEASKFQAWPEDFRSSFVSGCAEGETDPNAEKFCRCLAGVIEAAHVVPTKYNSVTTSQEQYGEQVQKIMAEYLDGPQGSAEVAKCSGPTL